MSAFVVYPSRSDTSGNDSYSGNAQNDVSATVNTHESADIFERTNETFRHLPLWMLERCATADVNDNMNGDLMLPYSIVQIAKDIMTLQIEEGEELKHGILTGVVGHVNGNYGMGQCFIDPNLSC